MNQIFQKYYVGEKIGSGHSSYIILAKSKVEDKYFAIKEYIKIDLIKHQNYQNHDLTKIFENESNFLKKIEILIQQGAIQNFKYINRACEILQICENNFLSYVLILEFAIYGNMQEFLGEVCLPEAIAQGYMLQMTKAIKIMHDLKYAHMDIKLDNLLLDQNFLLKLADFGLVDNKGESQQIAGTKNYMAPEVQTGQKYNPLMADIFSLGCTFLELRIGGLCAFGDTYVNLNNTLYVDLLQEPQKFWDTIEKFFEQLYKKKITIETQFKILIQNMLNYPPSKRPTIDQVLNDQYFKLYSFTEKQILEFMKQCFQPKGVYQLNSTASTGAGGHATLGTMEIEQVGLNQFRFKNIMNDMNFERSVKKFFTQIIAESSDMIFETKVTFEEIMSSQISRSEQEGCKVTTNLIRNMDNTCLLGMIMELTLDVINLYIIDVKGTRQEQNKYKKIIRNELKKKMKNVDQKNIQNI